MPSPKIYERYSQEAPREWRKSALRDDAKRLVVVAGLTPAGTQVGKLVPGTPLAEFEAGKFRPCGNASASAAGAAVNTFSADDAGCFRKSDVVSIIRGARLAGAAELDIDDGGGNTVDLDVAFKDGYDDHGVEIVVAGNDTAQTAAYDEANKKFVFYSATDGGGAATSTAQNCLDALNSMFGHALTVTSSDPEGDGLATVVNDQGPVAGGGHAAGDVIAAGRTITQIAGNVVTIDGAAITYAEDDRMILDVTTAGYIPYIPDGILEDGMSLLELRDDTLLTPDKSGTLALSGEAKSEAIVGYSAEMGRALETFGEYTDPGTKVKKTPEHWGFRVR